MTARNMGDSIYSFNATQLSPGARRFNLLEDYPRVNAYYKMRGFDETANQYYYWATDNPNNGAPYGLSLTDITIAAVLVDDFQSIG